MKYKLISDHAEDLADGRVLGPGEEAELDEEAVEDPHNQRLIEEGKLIPVEETEAEAEPKPKPSRASKPKEEE